VRPPAAASGGGVLAKVHPVLFHAAPYGSWESIAAHGLRTAEVLAAASGGDLTKLRDDWLLVEGEEGAVIAIRDQRPMLRANIADHLDRVTLPEWLALLNQRVFLFARQKDLTTLLSRYASSGQDVLALDTSRLLAAAQGSVEVSTVTSGEPVAWKSCPCRGRSTFVPLSEYRGPAADIEEVTVVGGLADVRPLVRRVMRHHPGGGTPELIAGR
jgi:hypothetical protein